MALLITFLAGLTIAAGSFVMLFSKKPHRVEHISIALALGALLSLMIFDLGPDVAGASEAFPAWMLLIFVAAGVGVLKLLDLFLPDHADTEANHDKENAVHIGMISALALILHNIIEGMTTYSLSTASLRQGAIFAFGIALHNVPMGMLLATTLEEDRRLRRHVVMTAVTLSTFVGGLIMNAIDGFLNRNVVDALVCIAMGMILYIVFAELVPHVIRTGNKLLSILSAAGGFILVFCSTLLG